LLVATTAFSLWELAILMARGCHWHETCIILKWN